MNTQHMEKETNRLKNRLRRAVLLFSLSAIICSGTAIYLWMEAGRLTAAVTSIAACALLLFFHAALFRIQILKPLEKWEASLTTLFQKYNLKNPADDIMEEQTFGLAEKLEAAVENKYATQLLYTQAQIDALQSQINPHFLYNTLEEIRGLAVIRDENDIADMTEALALMFRYSISQDNKNVTLEQELRNLENYILIQKFRFSDKFTLEYDIDRTDEILMNCRMPKLTIQPIVENAIQHGFGPIEEGGKITLRTITTQDRLLIRIIDNGVGMSFEKLEQLNEQLEETTENRKRIQTSGKTGIALINVNLRIKLNYGSQYGLFVSSTPNAGTVVEIRLPLLKEMPYAR